jgi:hypothetical protein
MGANHGFNKIGVVVGNENVPAGGVGVVGGTHCRPWTRETSGSGRQREGLLPQYTPFLGHGWKPQQFHRLRQ